MSSSLADELLADLGNEQGAEQLDKAGNSRDAQENFTEATNASAAIITPLGNTSMHDASTSGVCSAPVEIHQARLNACDVRQENEISARSLSTLYDSDMLNQLLNVRMPKH